MSLSFAPVSLNDLDRIYRYTSMYGEGSCQHSPVSMYSLAEKYADMVCEQDDALYTLRSNLCDDTHRVYLAPMTGRDIKDAFAKIIKDAESYNKKASFITLTETYARELENGFPGMFDIREERDLAEYMYRADIMAGFLGSSLRKRRAEVNTFYNRYGERASVSEITKDDLDELLSFERTWMSANRETHDADALDRDARMIEKQFEVFDKLGLFGVILRIDGVMAGFAYGVKLNDEVYDVIVEKADRDIPHAYKALRMVSAKQCSESCSLINYEEDVGIPGLRYMKTSYKPEYLLRKFIAIGR